MVQKLLQLDDANVFSLVCSCVIGLCSTRLWGHTRAVCPGNQAWFFTPSRLQAPSAVQPKKPRLRVPAWKPVAAAGCHCPKVRQPPWDVVLGKAGIMQKSLQTTSAPAWPVSLNVSKDCQALRSVRIEVMSFTKLLYLSVNPFRRRVEFSAKLFIFPLARNKQHRMASETK